MSSLLSHQDDDYCKLNVAISAIIVDHCTKSRSELSLIYARHFPFGESCATQIASRFRRDATGNLHLSGTVIVVKEITLAVRDRDNVLQSYSNTTSVHNSFTRTMVVRGIFKHSADFFMQHIAFYLEGISSVHKYNQVTL